MFVPDPPVLVQLERITPSIYEASIACLARAAWYALGNSSTLPEHPAGILGTAFHSVVATAHRGELPVEDESNRTPARKLFDKIAQGLYDESHQLVKLKFPAIKHLPFYNLYRERAAYIATPIAASRPPLYSPSVRGMKTQAPAIKTESRLCSKDGRIVGRADHIDGRSGTVVDYKTRHISETDADTVSNSETRQLRLYAYLAIENEMNVSKGAIIRGSGQRYELAISEAEAKAEADSARTKLNRLNAAISNGVAFRDIASPSSRNCASCPCIPFCESFWAEAKSEWATECGSHVEGTVVDVEIRQIQGVSLTTLVLSRRSGTVSVERVSIERIPSEWMGIDEEDLPSFGDVIRVVHGRQLETDESVAVIGIDKALTAVWRIRTENDCSGD